jgi:iron complex outermembrane receptor protein
LRYRHKVKKKHQLVIGTQGTFQTNVNLPKAEEQLIPNAKQFDKGGFLLWNWTGKTIETQLGSRYDYRVINSNNRAYSFQGLNFSAAIVKELKPFILRLSTSTGYRPPNLNELTSNGIHHGSIRYELGNENLRPEYANQIDLSLEFKNEHLGLTLNPFVNQVQNFVYLEAADSSIDGYSLYSYQQSKRVMLTGGDIALHYHPHFLHHLHLESTFSMLYTEDHLGAPLPFIPQTRINTSVQLKIKNKGALKLQNITVQHQYFFDQNKVATLETKSPTYQLFNVGAKLKWEKRYPLEISVGCKNVFNEAYIDHLSRLKNIELQNPGRNFYLGITWKINKTKNLHNHEKK